MTGAVFFLFLVFFCIFFCFWFFFVFFFFFNDTATTEIYTLSLHDALPISLAVKTVLDRHESSDVNFDCNLFTGTNQNDCINRSDLKDKIVNLFQSDAETALFFFEIGRAHV